MKFATLNNGTRDGQLLVVARNLGTAVPAGKHIPTLQYALENWSAVEFELRALYQSLNDGRAAAASALDVTQLMAPLPRAYQFIDASAFNNHGHIMERAFNTTSKKPPGVPVVIQRQADDLRPGHADYVIRTEADNCDFEGEVAVITDDIAVGTPAEKMSSHIKLLALFNDVSMRAHLQRELAMGFGFIQAKTASIFAPVVVTPDELGDAWRDGRVHLDLWVHRNGELFGHPNGGEMDFSFHQLLAHLTYNRNLRAGTILGTGTFSNRNHEQVGSACLAERRALEVIAHGQPRSPWMGHGERLRFEMLDAQGQSVFGAIDNRFLVG